MLPRGTSLILAIVLLAPAAAAAELFKWVDENGKIHYSDKKPEGQTESVVIDRQLPAETGSVTTAGLKPIIRPYEKTARKLHLLDVRYFWKQESQVHSTSKIGVFYTGKGCISRSAIKTPDVFIHHKQLLPDETRLTSRVNRIVNGLDYPAERTEKYRLLDRLKKTGGLSLHAEIVSLDVNSCAPNIRQRERLGPIENIAAHRFSKHRVKLDVKWQLRTNRDQDLVYETLTSGSYNGWNRAGSGAEAVGDALEAAVLQLFSDRLFINHVLVEEDAGDLQQPRLAAGQPIRNAGEILTRELRLQFDSRGWVRQWDSSKPVGQLRFGENCAAAVALPLASAVNRQKWLTGDDRRAGEAVMRRTQSLGYKLTVSAATLAQASAQTEPYRLEARLTQVVQDACAPSLSAATKYKPIDKIDFRKLTRNRLQVRVEWTLRTGRTGELLYRTSTAGLAGGLIERTDGKQALGEAIGNAAEQLFADREFVELIQIEAPKLPLEQVFANASERARDGIVAPTDRALQPLYVLTSDTPWRRVAADTAIGFYAFGEACKPYEKRVWPEALNQYSRLFPDAGEISSSASKVIKGLGYKHQVSDRYNVVNLQRKLGGLRLQGEIVDLRYDSCAPELTRSKALSGHKISAGQFRRHRVILRMQWKLIGQSESQVFWQQTTEGIADSWRLNSKGKDVMRIAVEDATRQLFAQPDFVAGLELPGQQEEGLLSGLLSFFENKDAAGGESKAAGSLPGKYLLQAHAASVFSEISVLKVGVLQHYMMEGEWPDSLESIGYRQSVISDSQTIDHINLQPDGSIVVELREVFGADKVIVMRPQVEGGGLNMNRWSCSSNLDAAYLPVNCETL